MVEKNDQQAYENNLLRIIIEQLRRPLLAICNESEILKASIDKGLDKDGTKILTGQVVGKVDDFRSISRNSLDLIDSFLWSYGKQSQNELAVDVEPVVVSSVFADVVSELTHYGRLYGCSIEVVGSGSSQLVLANRDNLKSALKLLTSSFIELSGTNQADSEDNRVILSTRKVSEDIEVGVFSPALKISAQDLARARNLVGKASQVLPQNLATVGANIMMAELLAIDGSSSQFGLSSYRGTSGFSKKLVKSNQLQLIGS